jgi:hypothetical protein
LAVVSGGHGNVRVTDRGVETVVVNGEDTKRVGESVDLRLADRAVRVAQKPTLVPSLILVMAALPPRIRAS